VIRIIVDMNLPPRWVPVLQAEGWETVHWSSIGAAGAADAEILKYAKDAGYLVMTHDLDFGAILAATEGNAPSVVQVRTQDVFPEAVGRLVIAAIRQFENQIEKGVLISVDESRSRARLLPLRF
jgi:predicted nuclease of predicted toxin-antitoxin system